MAARERRAALPRAGQVCDHGVLMADQHIGKLTLTFDAIDSEIADKLRATG
jgi:hypothetical protein